MPGQPRQERRVGDDAITGLRAELRETRAELMAELREMRAETKEVYVRREVFDALAEKVGDTRRVIGWVQGMVGAAVVGAVLKLVLEVKG